MVCILIILGTLFRLAESVGYSYFRSMQRNATAPKPQASADRSDVYWAYHDEDSPAKLTTTVVHALAEVVGEDATAMRERVYERIDPEALDLLFRDTTDGTPRVGGYLGFRVYDHQVTVYASGDIGIEPPVAPRPPSGR